MCCVRGVPRWQIKIKTAKLKKTSIGDCVWQQGGSLLFIQSVAGGGDLAATGPVHGGTEQGQLGMFCQGSESWHKELKEKKRAPTKKGCDELERISFEYNNVYRICPY